MYDSSFETARARHWHARQDSAKVPIRHKTRAQIIEDTLEKVIEATLKCKQVIPKLDRRARMRFKRVFDNTVAGLIAKERKYVTTVQQPDHRTKRRELQRRSPTVSKASLDRYVN